MKVLTLLGALLLITIGTSAYSPNCAKGPEYWCRDASTANDCGAVRHCEQTVWREKGNNKQSMTTSETAEMLCNVLVQASTQLLADKSIDVDSIKQYLRHDCTKLPHGNNLIQQCEMAVDIYLSDILRHIQSGTESTKICPILQGHDTSSAFIPKPDSLTSNATCVLCEFIIHLVESAATANASEKELILILEKVCTEMPAVLRAECKEFVDANGADIVALLVREIDPAKVCELIKICPKPKDVDFLTKPNLQTCGLCDYVSTYLSAGYPIENACTHFSTNNNIKQHCEILVHLYKPNICSQLPLCFDDVAPEQPIDTTIHIADLGESVRLSESKKLSLNSLECTLCEYIIGYIDKAIGTNRSAAAVEAALEKVCNILPTPVRANCTAFVNKYGAIIALLIGKNETPAQVCDFIKVCKNGTEEIIPRDSDDMFKVKELPGASVECSLCKFIVNYIDTVIQNNKSEAAIEAALEKVCTILPHALNHSCVQFVETYGPVLVQLIEKYGTAELVCDALKLCHNGTQAIPSIESKKSPGSSAECSLCKYVVSYVDAVIQTNKSEAAIDAALEKVCTILPHALNHSCIQFVDTFGPILVEDIAKYATAEQVCDALKLCHNGTVAAETISHNIAKPVKGDAECTLCRYVISFVNVLIESNATEKEIEHGLEVVCFILPLSYHNACKAFVTTYGPILPQLIAELDDPNVVCDWLTFCKKSNDKFIEIPSVKTNKLKALPCNLCEYLVNYLDVIIQSNSTEIKFEEALDNACKILPETKLQAECKVLVHLYGADLIKFIGEFDNPKTVCQELGICPK